MENGVEGVVFQKLVKCAWLGNIVDDRKLELTILSSRGEFVTQESRLILGAYCRCDCVTAFEKYGDNVDSNEAITTSKENVVGHCRCGAQMTGE